MLKPNVDNIMRMSESYLNQALDEFQGCLVTVALIDMRLNQMAAEREIQFERAKNAEIRRMMENARIQEDLESFFDLFLHGTKMISLINALEPDYINDYDVCEESYLVTSKVSRDGQNSYWQCADLKDAKTKVVNLAYWRVRSKYIKNGTIETLQYVKQKLVA